MSSEKRLKEVTGLCSQVIRTPMENVIAVCKYFKSYLKDHDITLFPSTFLIVPGITIRAHGHKTVAWEVQIGCQEK